MALTLRQIAEKRGETSFEFQGETANITYRADRLTKEFRAEALRLNREVKKSERRLAALMERVNLVVAPDGSIEAETEDADAAIAIQAILDDDANLKRDMDRVVWSVVEKWDLLGDDGKMVPLSEKDVHGVEQPSEILFQVPGIFLGACINAILQASESGGAQGAKPQTASSLPLRPKGMQETLRQSQNGTRTSRRPSTFRR